jgi:hypothetical protein
MRARGTTATPRPLRSPRRGPTQAGRVEVGKRDQVVERPAAPEHSTFRRVAVFVPFQRPGGSASDKTGTLQPKG